MEAEQKYYQNLESNLFEIKGSGGWFISADTKEDALGLANKRGNYSEDDIIQVGTCATIFGTSNKYEDVINIREKLISPKQTNMRDQLEQLYGEYMQLKEQTSDYLLKNLYTQKMNSIEQILVPMPYKAINPANDRVAPKQEQEETCKHDATNFTRSKGKWYCGDCGKEC